MSDEFDPKVVEALASNALKYLYYFEDEEKEGWYLPEVRGESEAEFVRNVTFVKNDLDRIISMKSKIPNNYEGELIKIENGILNIYVFLEDGTGLNWVPIEGEKELRRALDGFRKWVYKPK